MNTVNPSFSETLEQRAFRQNYLQALNKAFKYDESIGIMDIGEDKKISLQDIYIPLKFSHMEYPEDNLVDANNLTDILFLLQTHRQVLISGKPGSGKTTLSRSIINNLTSFDLTVMSNMMGRRLPLYFKLRDYKIDDIKSYNDFLQQFVVSMSKILKIDITKELIEFYLHKGWCCLLFDGVDEVGSERNRLKIRNFILKNFIKYNEENYILVTSRPAGLEDAYFNNYTAEESENIFLKNKLDVRRNIDDTRDELDDVEDDLDDIENTTLSEKFASKEENEEATPHLLQLYHVAPFDDQQILDYSKKWFLLREESPQVAVEKANEFIVSIESIQNLSILKRRPVFLSMMIHIHTTKGKLPYSRAKAYQYMVEAYIEHIDIARRLNKIHSREWSFEDKERVLEELAYKLHSSHITEDSDNNEVNSAQIILNKDELEYTIKTIIEENIEKWQTIQKNDEKELLEFYLSRTGLLHEPEENQIQFSHLSFQEYLTAHKIYRKVIENPFEIQNTIKNEIIDKLSDESRVKWNEVILLFFSLYKDATEPILNQFYQLEKENIHFHYLAIKLIESFEYGVKESDVNKWIERIINFILNYNQNKKNNTKKDIQDLKVFDLITYLFQSKRIQKNLIIDFLKEKALDLVHKKNINQLENFLYFISYDKIIIEQFQGFILENIDSFVSNPPLYLVLDILSEDFPQISSYLIKNFSLEHILTSYETISPALKHEFLHINNQNWKQKLMHYDWIISTLYGFIQLNRLEKNYKVESTLQNFIHFQNQKRDAINNYWREYWYGNLWLGHRNGFQQQLKNDILCGRYEYYTDARNQFKHVHFTNNTINEIYKNKWEHIFKTNRRLDSVLLSVFVLAETTYLVDQKYKIDLSIPWKTFEEFKQFSEILKNDNMLHKFLEDQLSAKIDFEDFQNEMNKSRKNNFLIKNTNKILKNKNFYTIYEYDNLLSVIQNIANRID